MRYLALAVEQLDALIHSLEDRSDARRSMSLDRLTRMLREDTHPAYRSFPAFDGSKVSEAQARWRARSLPNPLTSVKHEELPPALQQALNSSGEGALSIELSAEEVSGLFKR